MKRGKEKPVKDQRATAVSVETAALREEEIWEDHVEHTLNELRRAYETTIRPVEQAYEYDLFKPSWFAETMKQKKPFITFLGPFSGGKSTFINYLMQGEHLMTGPQPLTDKFNVIMYGERATQVPGRVLLADSSLPFRGLSQFGDAFAESFAGMLVPHPILKSVSFVDTPGVLEASGDTHKRRYNYAQVVRWFVEKSDLVFFLFDPTKLDAGAELRSVFCESLKGFESKIRIVLNKADTVKPQDLLRVYGALYWNLSTLVRSTEAPRVYVSSFWNKPYQPNTNHVLFAKEKEDLLFELIETVPLQSLDRRVTSVIKRANDVMIWSLLCATYRTRVSKVFGKDKAKDRFYTEYAGIVQDIGSRHQLSVVDFPAVEEVKKFLTRVATHKCPDLEKIRKKKWTDALKDASGRELPALLGPIKQHATMDPRDRRRNIIALREYTARKNEDQSTSGPSM